ncbi:MAG: ATP-binding cassette domain-containing protein, partial [Thiovulaceae bacterium]|nr:ATP-binding cassette domain-containing protein [Sulfurimonadaceae bacterium]
MQTRLLELKNIRKAYRDQDVLNGIDLEINNGEFLTLLGPSGCGKTTILRMIGGFEQPDRGEILLQGVNINDLPSHKRATNTVFQSYALFPHMS